MRNFNSRVIAMLLIVIMTISLIPADAVSAYTRAANGSNGGIRSINVVPSKGSSGERVAYSSERVAFAITPYLLSGGNTAVEENALNRYLYGTSSLGINTKWNLLYKPNGQKERFALSPERSGSADGSYIKQYSASDKNKVTQVDRLFPDYYENSSGKFFQDKDVYTDTEVGEMITEISGYNSSKKATIKYSQLYPEYKNLFTQLDQYRPVVESSILNPQPLGPDSLIFASGCLTYSTPNYIWYAGQSENDGFSSDLSNMVLGFSCSSSTNWTTRKVSPSSTENAMIQAVTKGSSETTFKGVDKVNEETAIKNILNSGTANEEGVWFDLYSNKLWSSTSLGLRNDVSKSVSYAVRKGTISNGTVIKTETVKDTITKASDAEALVKKVQDEDKNAIAWIAASLGPQTDWDALASVPSLIKAQLDSGSAASQERIKKSLMIWQYILHYTFYESGGSIYSGNEKTIPDKVTAFLNTTYAKTTSGLKMPSMKSLETISNINDILSSDIFNITVQGFTDPANNGADSTENLNPSWATYFQALDSRYEYFMDLYCAHYLDLLICAYACAYNNNPNSETTKAWYQVLESYCMTNDHGNAEGAKKCFNADACHIQVTPVAIVHSDVPVASGEKCTYVGASDYTKMVYNITEIGTSTYDNSNTLNKAFFGYAPRDKYIVPATTTTSLSADTLDTYKTFYARLKSVLVSDKNTFGYTAREKKYGTSVFGSSGTSNRIYKTMFSIDSNHNVTSKTSANWFGQLGGTIGSLRATQLYSEIAVYGPMTNNGNSLENVGSNIIFAYQWQDLYQVIGSTPDLTLSFSDAYGKNVNEAEVKGESGKVQNLTVDLNKSNEDNEKEFLEGTDESPEAATPTVVKDETGYTISFDVETTARSSEYAKNDVSRFESLALSLGTEVQVKSIKVNGEEKKLKDYEIAISGTALDSKGNNKKAEINADYTSKKAAATTANAASGSVNDSESGWYSNKTSSVYKILKNGTSIETTEELHIAFGEGFLQGTEYEIQVEYWRTADTDAKWDGAGSTIQPFKDKESNPIVLTIKYTPSESITQYVVYNKAGFASPLENASFQLATGDTYKETFVGHKFMSKSAGAITLALNGLSPMLTYASDVVITNYNDGRKSSMGVTDLTIDEKTNSADLTLSGKVATAAPVTNIWLPTNSNTAAVIVKYIDVKTGSVVYTDEEATYDASKKTVKYLETVTSKTGVEYTATTDTALTESYPWAAFNTDNHYSVRSSDQFLEYTAITALNPKYITPVEFTIQESSSSVKFGTNDAQFILLLVPVVDSESTIPVVVNYIDKDNPETVLKTENKKPAVADKTYSTDYTEEIKYKGKTYTLKSPSDVTAYYATTKNAKNINTYEKAVSTGASTISVTAKDGTLTTGKVPTSKCDTIVIYIQMVGEEEVIKVTYLSDPEAYAELKEGSVSNVGGKNIFQETYEAMAGVPSTELLFFSTGGSEFIVQLAMESSREQVKRTYETHFKGDVDCEFKENDSLKGGTVGTSITKHFVVNSVSNGKIKTSTQNTVAEVYHMTNPVGASSYNTTYNGHDSTTEIKAEWTGTIANTTADPGITDNADPIDNISGDGTHYSGKPGQMVQTGQEVSGGYSWNVAGFNAALNNAFKWASEQEAFSQEDTGNVWMLANSDGVTRSFHLGNAVIKVKFDHINDVVKDEVHTVAHVASLQSNYTLDTSSWDSLLLESNDDRLSSGYFEDYGHAEDISVSSCKGSSGASGKTREDATFTWNDEVDLAAFVPSTMSREVLNNGGSWAISCSINPPSCSGSFTDAGRTTVTWETKWCGFDPGSVLKDASGHSFKACGTHKVVDSPEVQEVSHEVDDYDDEGNKTGSHKEIDVPYSAEVSHMEGNGDHSFTLDSGANLTPASHTCFARHSTSGWELTKTQRAADLTYTITVTFKDTYVQADGDKYEHESVSGATTDCPNGKLPAHALCGPCCKHVLDEIEDTWTQEYEIRTIKITAMKVWRLDSGYVTGMSEITDDSKEVVLAESNLPQNLFYNIASTPTSAAGRIRYTLQTGQDDIVKWEEYTSKDKKELKRTNICDGLCSTKSSYNPYPNGGQGHGEDYAQGCLYTNSTYGTTVDIHKTEIDSNHARTDAGSDERDRLTEEWQRFDMRRNLDVTVTVISDMLLLQSTSGDESICYHEASQTVKAQDHPDKLIEVQWDSIYTNNPLVRKGNQQNNLPDRKLNIGSYNGYYTLTDVASKNKYTGTGNGTQIVTRFDDNPKSSEANDGDAMYFGSGHANDDIKETGERIDLAEVKSTRTVKAGTGYISSSGKSESRLTRPSTSLLLAKNDIAQKITNPNKEYVTGQSYAFFEEILVHDVSGTAWAYETAYNAITKKNGYTKDSIYARGQTKVNNIVVQDPVSVVSARILKPEVATDQRVNAISNTAALNDVLDTVGFCPGNPGDCVNRILSCTYFESKELAHFNIDDHTSVSEVDEAGNTYASQSIVDETNGIKLYISDSGYSISDSGTYLKSNGNKGNKLSIPWTKIGLDTDNRMLSISVEADIETGSEDTVIFETDEVTLTRLSSGKLELTLGDKVYISSSAVMSAGSKARVSLTLSNGSLNKNLNTVKVNGSAVSFAGDDESVTENRTYLGNYLRIGSDIRKSPTYVDNLTITKLAGSSEHTAACYTTTVLHAKTAQTLYTGWNGEEYTGKKVVTSENNSHVHTANCLTMNSALSTMLDNAYNGDLNQFRMMLGATGGIRTAEFTHHAHTSDCVWTPTTWKITHLDGTVCNGSTSRTTCSICGKDTITKAEGLTGTWSCGNLPLNAYSDKGDTKAATAVSKTVGSTDPVNKTFSYTGGIQSITLQPGTYVLEVWGAQGGDSLSEAHTTSGYYDCGDEPKNYTYGATTCDACGSCIYWWDLGRSGSGSHYSGCTGGSTTTVEYWGHEHTSSCGYHPGHNVAEEARYTGAKGGYSKGTLTLTSATTLYIAVGGAGNKNTAGYNGGGAGGKSSYMISGGGGGATSISTTSGLLSNSTVWTNAIIVAGGGAGASYQSSTGGGVGGGSTGGNGTYSSSYTANGGTQTAGYSKGQGAASSNYYTPGAGGGYYGGRVSAYTAGGGSGYIKATLTDTSSISGTNSGNGKAVIKSDSYTYTYYTYKGSSTADTLQQTVSVDGVFKAAFTSLNGTNAGKAAALEVIKANYGLIPETIYVNGKEVPNPIWTCAGKYDTHVCTSECINTTELTCTEPHHQKDSEGHSLHYSYDNTVCYQACHNDELHKESANAKDALGQSLILADYVFLDNYFQIYYANSGDFAEEPTLYGIAQTTQTRGMGYVDNMDTLKWLREKWVRFPFSVLYYRESVGKWEQYDAGNDIKLDKEYDYYSFYCLLKNDELSSASVEFMSEAINDANYVDDQIWNQDCPSSNEWATNRYRFPLKTAYHSAYKQYAVDVIGRIGNLILEDTDDIRYTNMFKEPLSNNTWYVENVLEKVDNTKQRYFLTQINGPDIRGKNVATLITKGIGLNTYKTLPWATGTYNSDKGTAGALNMPLSSDKNTVETLTQDNLKLGYKILWDISTIGSYSEGSLEVKPYVYALNLKTGALTPVDVYTGTEGNYVPINYFGMFDETEEKQTELMASLGNYVFYLDWTENQRRNYSEAEKAATQNVQNNTKTHLLTVDGEPVTVEVEHPASNSREVFQGYDSEGNEVYTIQHEFVPAYTELKYIYKQLDMPAGRYNLLGNLQLLSAGQTARTFIGSSTVGGVDINGAEQTELLNPVTAAYQYNRNGQRWHLYLGLPSNAVFVPYTDGTHYNPYTVKLDAEGNEYYIKDEITGDDDDYVFLLTVDITAFGEKFALHYDQETNGTFTATDSDGNTKTWNEDGALDSLPTLLGIYQGRSTKDITIKHTH